LQDGSGLSPSDQPVDLWSTPTGNDHMATINNFDNTARQQRTGLASAARDDRRLIRCATLAASSHNTQPWTFEIAPDAITLRPDLTRRCSVVDPDDAHLFKSLGCAAENLVQAAAAQGLAADVRFDATSDAVVVGLEPSEQALSSELFEAIGLRQCTRLAFDGTPVEPEELAKLELAGTASGARVVVITDRALIGAVGDLVALGNEIQLTDQAFRRELLSWIRFNPTTALRSGDGLAGRCTGNPPLPTWLGKLLAPVVIRARPQAERDTEHIRSSTGIAVVLTESDDKPAWVEAGRSYERFALQATLLEIRTAFVNQPIEVPSLKGRFEALLGLDGEHVQLAVRFGHGGLTPYSLRRDADAMMHMSTQAR
jgi:hypothetical protein